MNEARILKIKQINQNSLRQLVNIEELIRFGAPALAFVLAFLLTPNLSLQWRVLIVGLVSVCCYAILSTEIDRQPAYTLVVPFIKYFFSAKTQESLAELDFDLIDNVLIFKDRLVAIFKLEPIDIMLLSEQDRQIFTNDIQAFLNNQRGIHTQIITRNRGASQSDYLNHFQDITNQTVNINNLEMNELRDSKLAGYIQDMNKLLATNIVPIRDYYFLVEQKGDNSISKQSIENLQKLEQQSNRICILLNQAKIETKHLKDKELETFLTQFIREI
jgi:hypothetical protein